MIGCMGKTFTIFSEEGASEGQGWFVLFLFMKVRHFASQQLELPESQPFARLKVARTSTVAFPLLSRM